MYERGDASKEDIDIAMKLGAGYPMVPQKCFFFLNKKRALPNLKLNYFKGSI